MSGAATAVEPKCEGSDRSGRGPKRLPIANRKARELLRKADPVLARLIDFRPDFRPRAWLDELSPLDAFGTLIFQAAGNQLSVGAGPTIMSGTENHFGTGQHHWSTVQVANIANFFRRVLEPSNAPKGRNSHEASRRDVPSPRAMAIPVMVPRLGAGGSEARASGHVTSACAGDRSIRCCASWKE